MKSNTTKYFTVNQYRRYPELEQNDLAQVQKYIAFILKGSFNAEYMKQITKTNDYGYAVQVLGTVFGQEIEDSRHNLYTTLSTRKNTPAKELVPDRIYVQDQTDLYDTSLGQNHYDRAYASLLYEKEKLGIITPGDTLFETTSGSSGVAFAALATKLGYTPVVCIPAGGEKAREEAIRHTGAQLLFSDRKKYVNGFPDFIKKYSKDNPTHVFIHHSGGNIFGRGRGVNENVVKTMESIITEAFNERHYDIVVSALGNGTSTLGIGRKLQEISPETSLIGFETIASAAAFNLKYPGVLQKKFGLSPEKLLTIFGRHTLPGTSFPGLSFPALQASLTFLDDICLVADKTMVDVYKKETGKDLLSKGVIMYDHDSMYLGDYGRSTKAAFEVAKTFIQSDKKVLIVGYDKINRYDQ